MTNCLNVNKKLVYKYNPSMVVKYTSFVFLSYLHFCDKMNDRIVYVSERSESNGKN